MIRTRKQFFREINRFVSSASTLNENEISKFSKLSNEWWDTEGPFKALHSLNHLRVPFIKHGIQSCQHTQIAANPPHSPLSQCSILDVGCGGGLLSECLARLGAKVTAIDPCEESVLTARLHSEKLKLNPKVNYEVATIEQIKECYPDIQYDAITASEVIEHLENPMYFIEVCSSLLKPGGSLFLTTINRTNASWALGIITAEYVLNLVPKETHEWNKFVTVDEMASYLNNANLKLRQLSGMAYNPLTNSWSWSKSLCLNYAVHASKKH